MNDRVLTPEETKAEAYARFKVLGETRVRIMHGQAQLPPVWEAHALNWLVEQENSRINTREKNR